MQLVQQYIMVRGKLQPALKYKVAQPMYNRYKFEEKSGESQQEMLTLPSSSHGVCGLFVCVDEDVAVRLV